MEKMEKDCGGLKTIQIKTKRELDKGKKTPAKKQTTGKKK